MIIVGRLSQPPSLRRRTRVQWIKNPSIRGIELTFACLLSRKTKQKKSRFVASRPSKLPLKLFFLIFFFFTINRMQICTSTLRASQSRERERERAVVIAINTKVIISALFLITRAFNEQLFTSMFAQDGIQCRSAEYGKYRARARARALSLFLSLSFPLFFRPRINKRTQTRLRCVAPHFRLPG